MADGKLPGVIDASQEPTCLRCAWRRPKGNPDSDDPTCRLNQPMVMQIQLQKPPKPDGTPHMRFVPFWPPTRNDSVCSHWKAKPAGTVEEFEDLAARLGAGAGNTAAA